MLRSDLAHNKSQAFPRSPQTYIDRQDSGGKNKARPWWRSGSFRSSEIAD